MYTIAFAAGDKGGAAGKVSRGASTAPEGVGKSCVSSRVPRWLVSQSPAVVSKVAGGRDNTAFVSFSDLRLLRSYLKPESIKLDLAPGSLEGMCRDVFDDISEKGAMPEGHASAALTLLHKQLDGCGIVFSTLDLLAPPPTASSGMKPDEEGVGGAEISFNTEILVLNLDHAPADDPTTVTFSRIQPGDGEPSKHFIALIVGSTENATTHNLLGQIFASLLSDDSFVEGARNADTVEEVIQAMDDTIDSTAFVPNLPAPHNPSKKYVSKGETAAIVRVSRMDTQANLLLSDFEESRHKRHVRRDTLAMADQVVIKDGLIYSGQFCGGIISDFWKRWPDYWNDYKDGMTMKSVASIFFLFFACISPAFAFGELMDKATEQHIGISEMLLGTAIIGILHAIFSAQPLIILGGTGPMLVFTGLVFQLCKSLEIAFLPCYAWVGIWIGVYHVLLGATDACFLIKWCSRFTDEIFTGLIGVIFIATAFADVAAFFDEDSGLSTLSALYSMVLTSITFAIAFFLFRFRQSRYLHPKLRALLADFGAPIAITIPAILSHVWLSGVHVNGVAAPDSLQTTMERDWFINPFDSPSWVPFLAAGAAIPAVLLTFLDHNITKRIICSPDNKLRRAAGYHYDTAFVGVLIVICSLFGFPWLVGATVRSINHLASLRHMETVVSADGREKQEVKSVQESRITALGIHVAILAACAALHVLKVIPVAVVLGLFIYMGVVAMLGIQFTDRLFLLITESKSFPWTHYVRWVPLKKIHLFTFIQVICLILLMIVKSSVIGILFPILVALLIPLRMHILPKLGFTDQDLTMLDADELEDKDAENKGARDLI